MCLLLICIQRIAFRWNFFILFFLGSAISFSLLTSCDDLVFISFTLSIASVLGIDSHYVAKVSSWYCLSNSRTTTECISYGIIIIESMWNSKLNNRTHIYSMDVLMSFWMMLIWTLNERPERLEQVNNNRFCENFSIVNCNLDSPSSIFSCIKY